MPKAHPRRRRKEGATGTSAKSEGSEAAAKHKEAQGGLGRENASRGARRAEPVWVPSADSCLMVPGVAPWTAPGRHAFELFA